MKSTNIITVLAISIALIDTGPLRAATNTVTCHATNGSALGWTCTDLHDFDAFPNTDGLEPNAGVVFDVAGNMYGTAAFGGTGGMVWEITSSGVFKDLRGFGGGTDGFEPFANVVFDGAGNMYGTTLMGGANNGGTLWEITSSGVYKDLHDFGGTVTNADGTTGPDGAQLYSSITFDPAGNIYGTAYIGGPNSDGMVWELKLSGVYMDLHDFGGLTTNADGVKGRDGLGPQDSVVFDGNGNMYGTTSDGGPYGPPGEINGGNVWEITAAGKYLDLHDFGGTATNANGKSGLDGTIPLSSIVFDENGNMYGTTTSGGEFHSDTNFDFGGIVWEITSTGAYKDLHDFGGSTTTATGVSGHDGAYPAASIVFDGAGNMFGTTEYDGHYGSISIGGGMVWEITSTGGYRDLHDFGGTVNNTQGLSGTDGTGPAAGVTFDRAGILYGTAAHGGAHGGGMVFKLAPPVVPHSFGAGIQMISVPTNYTGTPLATVLGYTSPVLAVWEPVGDMYSVSPTPPAGSLVAGQGYWVRIPAGGATITTAGTTPATPFTIAVVPGWNMIGCPQATSVPVSSLAVLDPSNVSRTFADAASSGLVQDPLYAFQSGDTAYEVVTGATGTLQPYYGYWLYASASCTLAFP